MTKNSIKAYSFILSILIVVQINVSNAREIERLITIGSVQADWNGDGKLDKAILTIRSNEIDAALTVFLTQASGDLKRVLYVRNIVWHGHSAGQNASITVNKRKSIVLLSANESVGRNRWRRKLTIVYRDKQFLIAGFTHDSWDTLDLKAGSSCDINFLAGKIIKNKKLLQIKNVAPSVQLWLQQQKKHPTPVLCQ